MRYLLLILVFVLVSCSSKQRSNTSSSDVINLDTTNIAEQKTDGNYEEFDIAKYKHGVDSLLHKIVAKGNQTKLLVDTLRAGTLVFIELGRTLLSNVTEAATKTIKYTFALGKENSGLHHHLIVLTFSTSEKAHSIFTTFKKVALEKSGVPGLTYSSDYIVQCDTEIYWVNSNCAYSYANHIKFVELLKPLLGKIESEEIKCKCGKVLCR